MTELGERQARAQAAIWQDFPRSAGDRGDLGVWVTASHALVGKVLRDNCFGVRVLAGRAKFNYRSAFAQRLPSRVIGDLVGIPERHRRGQSAAHRRHRTRYHLDSVVR
ncbi:MAG: cytochrome P450 [Actinomycetota bacterium]|nr:cytochrome P450 [Actinomycetota bacterium]